MYSNNPHCLHHTEWYVYKFANVSKFPQFRTHYGTSSYAHLLRAEPTAESPLRNQIQVTDEYLDEN